MDGHIFPSDQGKQANTHRDGNDTEAARQAAPPREQADHQGRQPDLQAHPAPVPPPQPERKGGVTAAFTPEQEAEAEAWEEAERLTAIAQGGTDDLTQAAADAEQAGQAWLRAAAATRKTAGAQ